MFNTARLSAFSSGLLRAKRYCPGLLCLVFLGVAVAEKLEHFRERDFHSHELSTSNERAKRLEARVTELARVAHEQDVRIAELLEDKGENEWRRHELQRYREELEKCSDQQKLEIGELSEELAEGQRLRTELRAQLEDINKDRLSLVARLTHLEAERIRQSQEVVRLRGKVAEHEEYRRKRDNGPDGWFYRNFGS